MTFAQIDQTRNNDGFHIKQNHLLQPTNVKTVANRTRVLHFPINAITSHYVARHEDRSRPTTGRGARVTWRLWSVV